MVLPSSTTWDILDLSPQGTPISDLAEGALSGDLSNSHDFSSKNCVLSALGLVFSPGNVSNPSGEAKFAAYRTSFALPESITWEFSFLLRGNKLPETFDSLEDRVFIGVQKRGGYSLGLLVSKDGFALANGVQAFGKSVKILEGTGKILRNGSDFQSKTPENATFPSKNWPEDGFGNLKHVTVRMSYSQATGFRIGFAYTKDVYPSYYSKWYQNPVLAENYLSYDGTNEEITQSVSPPVEVAFTRASALVNTERDSNNLSILLSSTAKDVDLRLELISMRIASYVIDEDVLPEAKFFISEVAALGRRVILKSDESLLRGNNPSEVKFEWEVYNHPSNTIPKMPGGASSSQRVGTQDISSFYLRFKRQRSSDNGTFLSVERPSTHPSPLSFKYEAVRQEVRIILATDGAGNIITTAREVVFAINTPTNLNYNEEFGKYFEAELVNDGSGVVATHSGVFSGGTGSNLPRTSFIPEVPGLYQVSLRIFDGSYWSVPATRFTNVSYSDQILGFRPNMDYVWMSLPSFWDMVQGRSQIEVAWSAIAQKCAASMMDLFQHQLNSNIGTVQRLYQHRWFPIDMRVNMPNTQSSVEVCDISSAVFVSSTMNHISRDSFVSSLNYAYSPAPTSFSEAYPVVVVNSSGSVFQSKVYQHISGYLLLDDVVEAGKLILRGNTAQVIEDPRSEDRKLVQFTHEQVKVGAIAEGDAIVLNRTGADYVARVVDAYPTDDDDRIMPRTVELDDLGLSPDGINMEWQIRSNSNTLRVLQQPYYKFTKAMDLLSLGLSSNVLIEIRIESPISGVEELIYLPLLLATSDTLFVDWEAYLAKLSFAGSLLNQSITIRSMERQIRQSRVTAFWRVSSIKPTNYVEHIPAISDSTNILFRENTDYTIENGFVEFINTALPSVVIRPGSDIVEFVTPPTEPPRVVILTTGEVGYYSVIEVISTTKYRLSHRFSLSGSFSALSPRITQDNLPAKGRLWAEVMFTKNDEAVSNNFGTLIGFPASFFRDNAITVDYITFVKGTWFAFMGGTALKTLEKALDSALGLPLVEEDCVLVLIDETIPGKRRFVLKPIETPGFYSYVVDDTYQLAMNQTTGRVIKDVNFQQYKEWSRTDAELQALYRRLNESSERVLELVSVDGVRVEVTLSPRAVIQQEIDNALRARDALLPRYSALVRSTRVFDYVSNPQEVASLLRNDVIRQYHTFFVDINGALVQNEAHAQMLAALVDRWKPARTAVILFSATVVKDSITVRDHVTQDITLRMEDTVYTARFTKDDQDLPLSENQPNTLPNTLVGREDFNNPTNYDRYESGYAAGRADNYSGDGSFVEDVSQTLMVNTADSDLDCTLSFVWLPIEQVDNGKDFFVGEELELWDNDQEEAITGLGWEPASNGGPGVILHIGSGEHPQIGFSIVSPQEEHPLHYLVINFPYSHNIAQYGAFLTRPEGEVYVRGKTNGAIARILDVQGLESRPSVYIAMNPEDENHAYHRHYFSLAYIADCDVAIENGPRSEVTLTLYQAIGPDGLQVSDLDGALVGDVQAQIHPPRSEDDLASFVVPSFSPGFFQGHSGLIGTDLVTWGFVDVGEVTEPTNFDVYSDPLRNVFVGKSVKARKWNQVTHGFAQFRQPEPSLYSVEQTDGILRVEGWFLVGADPTQTDVPGDYAEAFFGDNGGCWVFFRNTDTELETPAIDVSYITGLNSGATVIGLDSSIQPADGHVLEVTLPLLTVDDNYEVIYRVYRKYVEHTGDEPTYIMSEARDVYFDYAEVIAPPAFTYIDEVMLDQGAVFVWSFDGPALTFIDNLGPGGTKQVALTGTSTGPSTVVGARGQFNIPLASYNAVTASVSGGLDLVQLDGTPFTVVLCVELTDFGDIGTALLIGSSGSPYFVAAFIEMSGVLKFLNSGGGDVFTYGGFAPGLYVVAVSSDGVSNRTLRVKRNGDVSWSTHTINSIPAAGTVSVRFGGDGSFSFSAPGNYLAAGVYEIELTDEQLDQITAVMAFV